MASWTARYPSLMEGLSQQQRDYVEHCVASWIGQPKDRFLYSAVLVYMKRAIRKAKDNLP